MIWQPLNLSEVCPPHSPVKACSSFGYVYLNLLVHLYGGSKDEEIKKKCDTQRDEETPDKYDFIVVGAGSSGCVVTNRLSENDRWQVLVLEAGSDEPNMTYVPALYRVLLGSNIDWGFKTKPNGKSCLARPEGSCPWPRGKVMGGSSSINSLAYIRGNRADYDGWAAMGNPGWSYEDVSTHIAWILWNLCTYTPYSNINCLGGVVASMFGCTPGGPGFESRVFPYFIKSENNLNIGSLNPSYHGIGGEQYISYLPYIDDPTLMLIDSFLERGFPIIDYNGREQVGNNQAQAFSINGERVSTNRAFIKPIRYRRKNLAVETNAEVTKVLIDENKKAYGVNYVQNNIKRTAYAKKEVIICGGTISSPKLLMLSGIGPKEHLENVGITVIQDLPVGKNLHDHVSFNGIILALSNETATTVSDDQVLQDIKEYDSMRIKMGPLSGNGPANFIAFAKTEPSLDAPDVEFQVGHEPDWRDLIDHLDTVDAASILPTAYYNGLTPRVMNLVPKSRGEILLNASNPDGPPLIFPNYLDDENDFIPLLKGVDILLSLENTTAFRTNGAYYVREEISACKDYEWGTKEYFICLAKTYTSTTYHPVGTCKMGPKSDKTAVLDNELRVHGVEGLRVIDASMMPVIVRGNTNAPAMMIGERGVDFVIKYWNRFKTGS
ncbi:unnamed protein product, partial [Brenthis ino]